MYAISNKIIESKQYLSRLESNELDRRYLEMNSTDSIIYASIAMSGRQSTEKIIVKLNAKDSSVLSV